MSDGPYITKGWWVQADWFDAQKTPHALAGAQLKIGATRRSASGIVKDIRGDHPTSPTQIEVIIEPDGGGDLITLKPAWIVAAKPPKEVKEKEE